MRSISRKFRSRAGPCSAGPWNVRGSELKEKGLAWGWGWRGCSPTDRGVSTWGKIVKGRKRLSSFRLLLNEREEFSCAALQHRSYGMYYLRILDV